ncbi:LytR/AlgR family response regulator transcription factor [Pseudidiomarina sediminum]|uniref:LytR/AlgR family response regulator transcription factor n=1 Tax=Pseudidiomarina sediminum TaxID=431675 RepID=UPI001FD4479A|nr:LytTR family DNA-binding domain-containing protein [Pseudidiomarina sediminum]
MAVKTRPDEVRFIAVASIERVETFGNYVKIYFDNERVLHRATLSDVKTLLDDRFIRIHRSHIVKRDHLRKLLSELGRYQEVELADETVLPLGGNYKRQLMLDIGL